jgi:hypothetical protein
VARRRLLLHQVLATPEASASGSYWPAPAHTNTHTKRNVNFCCFIPDSSTLHSSGNSACSSPAHGMTAGQQKPMFTVMGPCVPDAGRITLGPQQQYSRTVACWEGPSLPRGSPGLMGKSGYCTTPVTQGGCGRPTSHLPARLTPFLTIANPPPHLRCIECAPLQD